MAKSKAKSAGPKIGQGPAKGNFRANSARALYHARMAQFIGKPLGEFVASCAASPPSVPSKGKGKGQPEKIQGWVSWLTRNGYFTVA